VWEVLANLYLGDREDSRDRAALARRGITHVANCAAELPNAFPGAFRYHAMDLRDPDPDFCRRVGAAVEFIDSGRASGAVLVHCTAGVSRSPAVVLSYLCHRGRPLHEACAELSRSVLTGVDESFLSQIAAARGVKLSKPQLKALSLVLAGHGAGPVGGQPHAAPACRLPRTAGPATSAPAPSRPRRRASAASAAVNRA
jgi:hypothetical protein